MGEDVEFLARLVPMSWSSASLILDIDSVALNKVWEEFTFGVEILTLGIMSLHKTFFSEFCCLLPVTAKIKFM